MEKFTVVGLSENAFAESSRAGQNFATARLNYWLAQDALNQENKKIFRRDSHQFEALLMRRPTTAENAYAQFGLLLGAIPPAAIFYQISANFTDHGNDPSLLFIVPLFVLMNLICAFVGRSMGRCLANGAMDLERRSWSLMLFTMPFIGLLWGAVTGFFGGLLAFGLGAIGGFLIAAPIGAIAFSLFAIFHRLLERGKMIDRRHFLPIAFGTSLTIAAFIMGL